MSPLDVWYDRLDARTIVEMAPNAKIRRFREQIVSQAQQRIGDYLYPKISEDIGGRPQLIDKPPGMFHMSGKDFDQAVDDFALAYADQNEKDRAALVAAVKAGRIEAVVEEE